MSGECCGIFVQRAPSLITTSKSRTAPAARLSKRNLSALNIQHSFAVSAKWLAPHLRSGDCTVSLGHLSPRVCVRHRLMCLAKLAMFVLHLVDLDLPLPHSSPVVRHITKLCSISQTPSRALNNHSDKTTYIHYHPPSLCFSHLGHHGIPPRLSRLCFAQISEPTRIERSWVF